MNRTTRISFILGAGLLVVGILSWMISRDDAAPDVARPRVAPPVSAPSPTRTDSGERPATGSGTRLPGNPPAGATNGSRFQMHLQAEQAPRWAVEYGKEFWRRPAPGTTAGTNASEAAAMPESGINLRDVVNRVSHAWEMDANSARPQARARTYTASLDGEGVRISPRTGEVAVGGVAQGPVEARWRTVSVQRDDQRLYTAGDFDPHWSVLGNTAQARLDEQSGLVEHYEARGEGVEVTWVIPKALPGAGPLTVETELTGLSHAGESEGEHLFADASGGNRVRVGRTTVFDSANHRWDVATVAGGSTLRLTVPEEVLAQAVYPLAIDPLISPEFEMDSSLWVTTLNDQRSCSVAFNGTDYLVVWLDAGANNSASRIRGTRVSVTGIVRDFSAITIHTEGDPYRYVRGRPVVTSQGGNFYVVWEVIETESPGFVGNDTPIKEGVDGDGGLPLLATRVRGRLMRGNGTLEGVSLLAEYPYPAPGDLLTPAVSASSSRYLVVWRADDTGRVAGRYVLDTGALDLQTLPISSTPGLTPAVASEGTNFLVVWENPASGAGDIYAKSLVPGAPSTSDGTRIFGAPRRQSAPKVASNRRRSRNLDSPAPLSHYLVVYQDNVADSGGPEAKVAVRAGHVDVSGTGMISTRDNYVFAPKADELETLILPDVASDGANYLVVWERYFVDSNGFGVVVDGSIVGHSGPQSQSTIVVAHADGVAYPATYPAVAYGSGCYLVAFRDSKNGHPPGSGTDIYARRVTPAGAVLGDEFLVSTTPAGADEIEPAVGFNGSRYLVVWQDARNLSSTGSDIYGTRVNRTGVPLDPAGISICVSPGSQEAPAVAGIYDLFLVVWGDNRNAAAGGGWDIYANRVADDGSTLGIAPVCNRPGDQQSPAIAANPFGYVVAWEDNRNGNFDIFDTTIPASGIASDLVGKAVTTQGHDQRSPAVARSGLNQISLIVWEDYRGSSVDIYGRLVDQDGNPLAGSLENLICTATGNQNAPAVAWSDPKFLVAWEDIRRGPSTTDIFGRWVNMPNAIQPPPDEFLISASSPNRRNVTPAVAGGDKAAWVVWADREFLSGTAIIRGARVENITGAIVDTSALVINAGSSGRITPVVASSAGQVLVVSQGSTNDFAHTVGNVISDHIFSTSVAAPRGLQGRYYPNGDFSGPPFATRSDSNVNFDWGSAGPFPTGFPTDGFSVRWTGWVQPRFTDTWTFHVQSDDAAKLWINGQLIVNNTASGEGSGTIALTAGLLYEIQLDYVEKAGSANASLYWSSPQQPRQIIPEARLFQKTTARPAASGGVVGEYYDNMNFTGRKVTRIDGTIDHDWGTNPPHPDIGADTYSVRWSGLVQPEFSEQYTFYTLSDDGVRLWVDNQLLIDNWTDHGATENSGTIALQTGRYYEIRMEYFENGGGAVARLSWSSPSRAKQIIPSARLFQAAPARPPAGGGLVGEYYDNIDLTGPKVMRIDATVNRDWEAGSPDPGIDADAFSVRWSGLVQPEFSETYTFYTLSDDGVRLWVDNQLLINNWTPHGPTENSDMIALQAGRYYEIRMEYFESGGGAVARLSWSSASQAKEIIPTEWLYPVPAGSGRGLRSVYVPQMVGLQTPVLRRLEDVNFDWAAGSPAPGFPSDRFNVTWRGLIQPQVSDRYVFSTLTDDGVRLRINRQTVIDRWLDQPATEVSSHELLLDAGRLYEVEMDYFEGQGDAVAKLYWTPSTGVKHIIPRTQLYPFDTTLVRDCCVTTVSWDSIAGNTYRVWYKNTLNDATWTLLPGDVTASGSTASKQDVTTNALRTYRVELLQP